MFEKNVGESLLVFISGSNFLCRYLRKLYVCSSLIYFLFIIIIILLFPIRPVSFI